MWSLNSEVHNPLEGHPLLQTKVSISSHVVKGLESSGTCNNFISRILSLAFTTDQQANVGKWISFFLIQSRSIDIICRNVENLEQSISGHFLRTFPSVRICINPNSGTTHFLVLCSILSSFCAQAATSRATYYPIHVKQGRHPVFPKSSDTIDFNSYNKCTILKLPITVTRGWNETLLYNSHVFHLRIESAASKLHVSPNRNQNW